MSRKLLKHTAVYTLGAILTKTLGFLLIPIYTRYLSVEEYGALNLLNLTVQLLALITLMGINDACMRLYFNQDVQEHEQPRIYGNGIIALLLGPILLAVPMGMLLHALTGKQLFSLPFYPLVFMVLIISLLTPIIALLQGLLRSQRRPKIFILFAIGFFATQAVLVVLALTVFDLGLKGVVLAQLVSNAVFWIIALTILLKYAEVQYDRKIMKSILLIGIPIIPFFIFTWISEASSRFMLEHYASLTEVGIFALAMQFAGIMNLFASALNNAMLPNFYQLANKDNNQAGLRRFAIKYITLFMVMAIFTILVSEPLILIAADEKYHASIGYVPLIVIATLIYIMHTPFVWSLIHSKKTGVLSSIRVVMAALMIAALYLSLGVFGLGITGAIIASTLVNLIVFLIKYRVSVKYLSFTIWTGQFFRILLVFSFTMGLLFIVGNYFNTVLSLLLNTSIAIASSLALFRLAHINILHLLRAPREEIDGKTTRG